MKTLVTILVFLMTFNVYSQSGYKLYSKVWLFDYNNKEAVTQPINGLVSFRYDYLDSVNAKIDTNKIKSYLLESFNEFRNDYGKCPVIENLQLTSDSQKYSKKLVKKYCHDKITKGSECISMLPLITFTLIKKTDGDFNKLVAESIFDVFVTSKNHMDILLDDEYKQFGFGFTIENSKVHIVVRGI
jgi:uncharacterized protein YkwD